MIPHRYPIDSQTKSSELAGKILAANAPPQIVAAVAAVESHLQAHSPDQNRHFFSITFPTLICKFFGFEESSAAQKSVSSSGWMDTVSSANDSGLAGRLFNLFSPNGLLMSVITAVDRLSLVKYVFPVERLPQWVRLMLSNDRDCRILSDLCPLFKGRLKEDRGKGNLQVQLNVFEYYIFWFAYFPVSRGNGENLSSVSIRKSRKFRLENWTSSISVFSGGSRRGLEKKTECNLYMRLLYAYLRMLVPLYDANAWQTYRSSLLQYSNSYDEAVILRAEFLVNTLVHFWLVDNDFSPLPVSVCKSFGVMLPFRLMLGETPPIPGLGEVVKVFVNYLNMSSVMVTEESVQVEHSKSPRWRRSGFRDVMQSGEVLSVSPGFPLAHSWNSLIQRPLYRFILRTFLFCPLGASMKNVSEVISLWIRYTEPWKHNKEEFSKLEVLVDSSNKVQEKDGGQSTQLKYSSIWQGYVLSNYLFYTSLVMHFIGFAHKFLHTDAELIVQLLSKIINVLTSSKELLGLIKNVDTVFHSKNAGSGRTMVNSMHKFVAPVREQLQDWEDGLCESDVDGSFLHENWNRDLRLFSVGDDGGQQLLQLFILRAEAELQAISSDANNLQSLGSLKEQLGCLFGVHAVKPNPNRLETRSPQQSREEVFKPRKKGNQSEDDIKYKGDWMRRPISDDEVAWLAKLLIRLSGKLNERLGLHQRECILENPAWSYLEVPVDMGKECEPAETLRAISGSIVSSALELLLAISRLMIRHRLKVNLRPLASKKFVTFLLVLVMLMVLKKKAFWSCS
ncbi:hypothetical protein Nepgr_011397 [Nepenthes gracilis]|uniref:Sphingomyelin phosphodiesterase 4 n=1 Tax=Nepenthes gracilis TaxID=150966 RepID=A0AAD3XMD1_NEPGR|nr:hypothetical protein Nepgr_011397 [Nepenthes gracilis]